MVLPPITQSEMHISSNTSSLHGKLLKYCAPFCSSYAVLRCHGQYFYLDVDLTLYPFHSYSCNPSAITRLIAPLADTTLDFLG